MKRLLAGFLVFVSSSYAAFTAGDRLSFLISPSAEPDSALGALPLDVHLLSTPSGYSSDLAFTWRLYEDSVLNQPFYERSLTADDFYEFTPLHFLALAGFSSPHWQDLQGISVIDITSGSLDFLRLEYAIALDGVFYRGASEIPEPASWGVLCSATVFVFAALRRKTEPNKAMERSRVAVTDRADARSAPSTRLAHL